MPRRITKGKLKGRVIPLHPLIQREMQLWLDCLAEHNAAGGPWLFPQFTHGRGQHFDQEAGHMNKTTVRYWMWRGREALGLGGRVATHSLRKSFAALVLEASGNNVLVVQELLGHKDVATTMTYLSVKREQIKSAVAGMFG